MKNEKGITMMVLVVTVIIMAILAGVAVNYGVNSLSTIKLQNFKYELEQVQGKVDTIYEKIKLGEDKYITLGTDITESPEAMNTLEMVRGINYSNILEFQRDKYYYYDNVTYYRYLTENDVRKIFDITSDPGDMIINFKTRDVISVQGFEYDQRTYYALSDM